MLYVLLVARSGPKRKLKIIPRQEGVDKSQVSGITGPLK